MRNEVELDYLPEIFQMNLAIHQKEFELQSLIKAEDDQDKSHAVESEAKTLKEKASAFTDIGRGPFDTVFPSPNLYEDSDRI